jgi:hypothetical protein
LWGFSAGSAPTAVLAQQETEKLREVDKPGENARADVLPKNFLGVKAGVFTGAEELADDIFYPELVLGRYLIARFFAIEGNVGYLSREDTWGIPFFLNARGGIPIRFLEPHGGLGIGGIYLNSDNQIQSVDEVVFAADFFLGLNWNLGERVYLGAEAKYILTQETDLRFNLAGSAVMGSLALRFRCLAGRSRMEGPLSSRGW